MAGTESDSTTENPQEEQDMKAMFKSMMKEFKDYKQSVVTLMESSIDGEPDETILNVESDGETSRHTHEAPSNSRTTSKNLLTEVVQELDISEKTGADVDEELVQLIEGLLIDKLQDKTQLRVDKYPRPGNVMGLRTPRVNPLIWHKFARAIRNRRKRKML